MEKRTCALETCGIEFEPNALNQQHCSKRHATLHRQRRFQARRRLQLSDPPPSNPTPPKPPQRDQQWAEAGIM